MESQEIDRILRSSGSAAQPLLVAARSWLENLTFTTDDPTSWDEWYVTEGRAAATQDLREFGVDAVPFLCELLKHDNGWLRLNAAKLLGDIGDLRSVDNLSTALKDERQDWRVVNTAAESLRRMGESLDIPPLSDLLKAAAGQLCGSAAARQLGASDDIRAIAALRDVLAAERPEMTWHAKEDLQSSVNEAIERIERRQTSHHPPR